MTDTSLAELSGLSPEELALFEQAWAGIGLERRRQIVSRLVKLADDSIELSFDGIFKKRLRDPDAGVRSQAIEGLWECEEPSLIAPLVSLLEEDTSEIVQTEAAAALGRFAMLAEQGKLEEDNTARVRQALLAAINDGNKAMEVRCCALESVGPLNFPEVNRAIMESYRSDDDRLSLSSVCAMGSSCDPFWLPILLQELSNANAEMRCAAAAALGELEEESTVPQLTELIYDEDADVQLAAIQALGEIGGSEARECLELCMDDSNETICQAAERALEELVDKEGLQSFHA